MSSLSNNLPRIKSGGDFPRTGYSLDTLQLQHLFPHHTIDCTRFRLDPTRKFYRYDSELFRIEIRNLWRGQQVLVRIRSLPRLMYRTNLFCLSETDDIARALEKAADELCRVLGVWFPVWEATVTHLEINRDHFLSDLCLVYLDALATFTAPRLETKLHPPDGGLPTVEFLNKSRKISFYLKWWQLECKHKGSLEEYMIEFANGMLRCEIELFGRVLARFAADFQHVRVADRTARTLLSPEFLAYAHERMLREARLDEGFPEYTKFRRNARRIARRAYPRMSDDTLTRMFHVVRDASRHGTLQAREKHSPRFVRYAKEKLSALGLWCVNFASTELLPFSAYPFDNPAPESIFTNKAALMARSPQMSAS